MLELSEEQKLIITAPTNKNIRIIASAGSGKTTTLIARILTLVKTYNIPFSQIILTTFTRDATEMMKSKIKESVSTIFNFMCGTIDAIDKRILHNNKIVDENSLLSVAEYIHRVIKFSKTPDGEKYFKRFKYIFVDEYQDIDYPQHIFFKRLNQLGIIITVVGDDNQNIYSFRHSDVNYLINFDKYFDNTLTFFLKTNYRSVNPIIDIANDSIKNNKNRIEKEMLGTNRGGSLPLIVKSNFNNYDQIILFDIMKKIKKYPLHEIAILSRNNHLLTKIENILYKYGIANVLLRDDDIRVKMKPDHITLSTIHKSKGLEFHIVYLLGCDDAFFPRVKDFLKMEEERRLFYVGTTRAKTKLYYFYLSDYISRFLTEVNPELIKWDNAKIEDKKLSDYENLEYKSGVTELIKNLRGEDYIRLRNNGILPKVKIDKHHAANSVYPDTFVWSKFVKKENLYTEYGHFFDTIITRFILEERKQDIVDHAAFKVLHNILLNNDQTKLINKYKYNFKYNLTKILEDVNNFENNDSIKTFEAKKCIKQIEENDKQSIKQLVDYLKKHIKDYNVADEDIFLSKYNYDKEQLNVIKDSYTKFKDPTYKTIDILPDVFNVSKCNSIIDNRLRMLYVKILNENINEYSLLINLIKQNFIPYIKKFKRVDCKKYVKYDIYNGECDLVCDDLLIDYKCSEKNFIQIEWVLQLLCYTQMLRDENYIINRIGIFNVFNGKLFVANISKWNKGKELFDYLLDLQEKMLAKDHKVDYEVIEDTENICNITFESMEINPFMHE